MVGSSIGWVQAPYVPCPADPEQIVAACVALRGGAVHIVPGVLAAENRLRCAGFHARRGNPDSRRPELSIRRCATDGVCSVCPARTPSGSLLQDGVMSEFLTALTGELFALLRDHSVLVQAAGSRSAT